jgi:hypothetical protein
VVLWALVILGALSTAAFVSAMLDLRLALHHQDFAAALSSAETGLAEALAAVARQPTRAAAPDSVRGAIGSGTYRVRWEPAVGGFRVVATGVRGSAERRVEAWVSFDAGGGLRISAWREVR